jgi:enoyl-CoA hydratase/carnithine racemase
MDPSVKALIVTGSGSSFSAGVDLFAVIKDGPDYGRRFLPVLDEMLRATLTFPKPVVAAVNGHTHCRRLHPGRGVRSPHHDGRRRSNRHS